MTIISNLTKLNIYLRPNPQRSLLLWLQQGTAVVLFAFCLMVSGLQYFGEPIQCVQDHKDEDAAINERVMNSFCFISGTYTISKDSLGYGCDNAGRYVNQGVGANPSDSQHIRRHSYYIWIPFLLFFQALTFLLPNFYWTYSENGLIQRLLKGLSVAVSPEQSKKKLREISSYFQKRLNTYQYLTFAWIFHDFLAVVNVLGNFFLTDTLLGGRFKSYGTAVLSYNADESDCWNPMEDAFPKVTKCTFYKIGAGGGMQNFDALCVMALNVVNQKIYLILWFWFLFLTPLAACFFLLKIGILICFKCLTRKTLKVILQFSTIQLLTGIPSFPSPITLDLFVERFGASDWIFFTRLLSSLSCATVTSFIGNVKGLLDKESGNSSESSLV